MMDAHYSLCRRVERAQIFNYHVFMMIKLRLSPQALPEKVLARDYAFSAERWIFRSQRMGGGGSDELET